MASLVKHPRIKYDSSQFAFRRCTGDRDISVINYNYYPLYVACANGRIDIVQLLLMIPNINKKLGSYHQQEDYEYMNNDDPGTNNVTVITPEEIAEQCAHG